MDPQTFVTCLIAVTLLTLTPGVDTMLVIRNSARGGWLDGAVSSLGICSGLFVHAAVSALGISIILLQTAWAFTALKLAVGIAGHTAVLLHQVAQCLIGPVGGQHIRELGDAGDLVFGFPSTEAINVLLLHVVVDGGSAIQRRDFLGSCGDRCQYSSSSCCKQQDWANFQGCEAGHGASL